MTKEEQKAAGRKARRLGAKFERDTRKDMISKGWIVDKFTNNIDLDTQEIVQAKSNQFNSRSCGFPDFLMFRPILNRYELIFVECKLHGRITKLEKQKLEFLRSRGHKCYVAEQNDERKEIIYREFVEYKEPNRVRREDIGD